MVLSRTASPNAAPNGRVAACAANNNRNNASLPRAGD